MAPPPSAAGPTWTVMGPGIWSVAAGSPAATTVVVGGRDGMLLVDPPADEATAAALDDATDHHDLGEVVAVVLTHVHAGSAEPYRAWDHAELHAHEDAPLPTGTPVRTLSSVAVLDLGDRTVELVHPGRAHTGGDLVVHVPGADVLVVGGLVSGHGVPAYGPDCFPLEWPAALDLVVGLTTPSTAVVPRTGPPLTRPQVEEQRAGVGVVAETIADLAGRGVPPEAALDAAGWPFPADRLGAAVRRGYDQLPRTARRLPLL